MRYVKGTCDYGLLYDVNSEFKTLSDADYAGDSESRKSTSGILCMHTGAAISWQSKKQQCVALSTTEAKYVNAVTAAKNNVWTRFLNELKFKVSKNLLFVDNQSAVKLIKNSEFHQRSKHIDVKYHFIRDLYENKIIDVKYICTDYQLADIFTKPLYIQNQI